MNRELRRVRRAFRRHAAVTKFERARFIAHWLGYAEQMLHEAELNQDDPAYRMARAEQSDLARKLENYIRFA